MTNEEWKTRIDDQPIIMQTVDGFFAKHDTQKTGYLNIEQAKSFIVETLQQRDMSDDDFDQFYTQFSTPSNRGISKHMMARYIWKTMNDDPF